ncbi:hypothetical protein ASPACDRAFT_1860402 [Aspergillus aculeatus ATCC 16872]|uniref:Uncharacterized protein n=1 Tax=Aspergillus aculeatus (strain ATCC 16872 / CBS 172.66 / WB 5094) TaxID=690307 RepID=A0A1L9WFT3_ASPA1|nr:uncharacterized protein ASPACDRAFT_1860402 [Aspergillus aculeatus ATCC 16872]OJJ95018.1 hypothetical protein ASPACDRAFT_1860402 [Aspergillus aculeatus ATCC 16872]
MFPRKNPTKATKEAGARKRRIVAVVARRSTASFLLGGLQEKLNSGRGMLYAKDEDNIESIIKYYAKLVLTPDADPLWAKTLKELVFKMWRKSEENPRPSNPSDRIFADETMLKILKAAFGTQDSAFFKEAARCHKGKLSMDFFAWAQEQFACEGSSFAKVQDGLRSAVLAFPDFKQRHTATARLVPRTQFMSDEVRSWVHSVHDQMLEMMPRQELNQQDGHAVVGMAMMYYDFPYLLTRIAPSVKATDRGPFFALGFLSQLDQQLKVGTFPKEEGFEHYREIACGLLCRLHVSTFNVNEKPKQPKTVDPSDTLAYYRRLRDLQNNRLVELDQKTGPLTPEETVTFVESLNPAHPSVAGFSQTLAAILRAYISNYVGLKPSPATSNLVHPTVQSCCGDCYDINRFLRDPASRVWVQPMNKRRRAHIHQKLDQARVDCTNETDHSRATNPRLVVIKTFAQVRDSQLAWQQRKLEASKQIQNFDPVRLAILLSDYYEDIVRMRALDVPSEQPVASRSEFTPASLAGMKRTAEEADFVDLTLDD